MTTALVKDHPWSLDRSRAGLVDRAVAAEARLGGRRVRVLPEPMLRRGPGGGMLQAVRLLLDEPAELGQVALRGPSGQSTPVQTLPGPAGGVRLGLPAVAETTRVVLELPGLGAEAQIAFEQLPVREWSIHLIQHSHYDIGYTDPQGRVMQQQLAFLDSTLDLARATKDRPAASQFRWSVESLWPLARWLRSRPRAHVEEFMDLVRGGTLELTALPYNLHMDTCSTEEMHELLRLARDLRAEHGVEILSAMQTDVPGQPVGLPAALAQQGVEYLSVAHNWAGRSVPHLIGGQHLPRLFRWASHSGESVLVWMTDTPHGLAYNEAATVGFSAGYETVDELLPAYLTALATQPYPYGPGDFGWHGGEVTDREPYPHDVLHMRVLGRHGDNAPATVLHADIVHRWNETWEFPRLQMSTNTDFFRAAEQRLGDAIPTLTGDWGDWWVEGVGSAAHPQAMTRTAQARATDSQVLDAVGRQLGGEGIDDGPGRSRRLYEAISMFNEHTWGAMDPWTVADDAGASGEDEWTWKRAAALEARDEGELLVDAVAAHVGAGIGQEPDAVATFQVINTTGARRSSIVSLFVPEGRASLTEPLEVRDARSGEVLAAEDVAQSHATHRAAGRFLRVIVQDVPPAGAVRLSVHRAADDQPAATDRSGGEALEAVLENEHLRVEVDLRRAAIASILDRASGRELVKADAVTGMNAYIYDTYTSAPGYNHQSNKTASSTELELLGSRSLARPAALLERTQTAVEQRLTYEFAAPGADWVQVTLRLPHGAAHLVIENRLAKPTTMEKESAFFSFPFAVDAPRTRYEITGGLTGPDLPELPGAPQHMKAIRDWVSVEDDGLAIAWASADAPLIHPEVISLPYAPFPESISPRQPGTVYSWVHNNVWDTNFPVEQAFVATFRYAIGVRRAGERLSVPALADRTAAELTRPLAGVLATGRETLAADAPAELSLLQLDDDRVRLVSVQATEVDGERLVTLQSHAEEPLTVHLRPGAPVASAARATYLGDHLGSLPVQDGLVPLELAPQQAAAVLLTLEA